ncbi:hypothetical protein D3C73_1132390 [compost metagenome]
MQQNSHGKAYGEGSHRGKSPATGGRAKEHCHKQGRPQDFNQQDSCHLCLRRSMVAKTRRNNVKRGAGIREDRHGGYHEVHQGSTNHAADDLRRHVCNGRHGTDSAGNQIAQGDSRVEVSSGDITEGQHCRCHREAGR